MTSLADSDIRRGSAFCVVEVRMMSGETGYLLVQEGHKAGRQDKWKNPGGRRDKRRELDEEHGFRGTALREIREELDRNRELNFTLDDIGEEIYGVVKDRDSESPHVFVVFKVSIAEDDLDKIEIFQEEIARFKVFSAEEIQKMVAHTEYSPQWGLLVEHHAYALRNALTSLDPWEDVAEAYAT